MTEHLRHEEFVDALDETLDVTRLEHLEACGECQAEMAKLRATVELAQSVEIPEPSPLFWDHFSERVRQATVNEPVTVPWWSPENWLRPVGLVAAAVAAIALVIVLRPRPEPVSESSNEIAAIVTPPDDGSWGFVMGLASELNAADVQEVAKPKEGTADAMIAELSAAQRRALAQLLKDEIGAQ